MKIIKQIIGISIFMACLMFSINMPRVSASTTSDVPFSVQPILPENQYNADSGYFDLLGQENHQQEIQVELVNMSDGPITVTTEVVNSATNVNGLIIYSPDITLDESLEEPITDLVTSQETDITLQAGESRLATFDVAFPDETFEGVKLGGLIFKQKDPEETTSSGAIVIQNELEYVIGISLTEGNFENVDANFNLVSVSADISNGFPAVIANIQNAAPLLFQEMTIQADIYEKNGDQVIASKSMDDVSFAPNSTMPFTVEWDQALKAGDYRIDIVMTRGDQDWTFTKEFTIQPEEEEEINEAAVTEVVDDSESLPTWVIIGAILVVIVIIALIAYVLHLKRKLK